MATKGGGTIRHLWLSSCVTIYPARNSKIFDMVCQQFGKISATLGFWRNAQERRSVVEPSPPPALQRKKANIWRIPGCRIRIEVFPWAGGAGLINLCGGYYKDFPSVISGGADTREERELSLPLLPTPLFIPFPTGGRQLCSWGM